MANKQFILTKNEVIEKMYLLMGEVCRLLEPHWQAVAAALGEVPAIAPKISKGEKHEGFPWVVLDYPRIFSQSQGYCALRTFFWWGHYFSIQWMVSGRYYTALYPGGTLARPILPIECEIWAGIPQELWSFAVPQPGLSPMPTNLQLPALAPEEVFKCAVQLPLEQWKAVPTTALQLLTAMAPVPVGAGR